MRIHLGSDHAGYNHKNILKEFLVTLNFTVVDHGAIRFDADDDYTDFVPLVVTEIQKNPEDRGIVFGGSGQGEAMVANRSAGIRAAVYYGGNEDIITLSREHNDANILSIGARFVDVEEMKKVVLLWLNTEFLQEERHIRRLKAF